VDEEDSGVNSALRFFAEIDGLSVEEIEWFKAILGAADDGTEWGFEWQIVGSLYIAFSNLPDMPSNLEYLADVIQEFLREFRSGAHSIIEYAEDRGNSCGGGWVLITSDDIRWNSTKLQIQEEEERYGENPYEKFDVLVALEEVIDFVGEINGELTDQLQEVYDSLQTDLVKGK